MKSVDFQVNMMGGGEGKEWRQGRESCDPCGREAMTLVRAF